MKRPNRYSVRLIRYVKASSADEAAVLPNTECLGTMWPTGGYYMNSKTVTRHGKWWRIVCQYIRIPF